MRALFASTLCLAVACTDPTPEVRTLPNGGLQVTADALSIAPGAVTTDMLEPTGVTPGTFERATITVDASGRLTAAHANAPQDAVSRVDTGAGLMGGPITATGEIAIAPGGVTPDLLASNAGGLARVSGGLVNGVDGNVGIGTSTPAAALHVTGAVNTSAGVLVSGTSTGGTAVYTGLTVANHIAAGYEGVPYLTLATFGGTVDAPAATPPDSSVGAHIFVGRSTRNQEVGRIEMLTRGSLGTAPHKADMVFWAGGAGADGDYRRMRIAGDTGFVGIGVSNPTAMLDVKDDVKVGGALRAGVMQRIASGTVTNQASIATVYLPADSDQVYEIELSGTLSKPTNGKTWIVAFPNGLTDVIYVRGSSGNGFERIGPGYSLALAESDGATVACDAKVFGATGRGRTILGTTSQLGVNAAYATAFSGVWENTTTPLTSLVLVASGGTFTGQWSVSARR